MKVNFEDKLHILWRHILWRRARAVWETMSR
jgi:hypothetical protein